MRPSKLLERRLAQIVPWPDVDLIEVDDPSWVPAKGSFIERTTVGLSEAFHNFKHSPSDAMWVAIEDIARTIGQMAEGELKPIFYSSSLDPGVGKTQTIVHAVRNLRKDVGVLICLSRINEVNNLVKDMKLDRSEFAVLVGERNEDRIDDFGNENIDEARVLFTTQQKVDIYLKNVTKFSDLLDLYFRGKPRAVRIWDESLLPGKEITLNIHDIAGSQRAIVAINPALADLLSDMQAEIKQVKDGDMYAVPNFESYKKAFQSLRVESHDKVDRDTMEYLWQLSGKSVRVRRDSKGNSVLDYTESLPDDFAPLLILDASARVRTTYKLWLEKRGNLSELRHANKRYRDLTIHLWDRGGGKTSFRDEGTRRDLVEGIASAINSKPDEDWLVIVHKRESEKLSDIREAITALITNKSQKIHFLIWGNHHATNQYVNVKNVILAGTLFYPESTYEVRGRAAAGMKTDQELLPDTLQELKIGEHAHLILQALCRGSVRKCVGDSCAPMDAYIIASSKTGIPASLPKIFRDCRVVTWEPIDKPLQGKIGDAANYLRMRWTQAPECEVSFKEVMEHLSVLKKQNFNKMIRNDPRFQRELKRLDAYETGKGRYYTHFGRVIGKGDKPSTWA